MLRAVLDTNLVIASGISRNPQSPNREIIERWLRGEFTWLISEDIAAEYADKLLVKGIPAHKIRAFLADLFLLAETVEIRFFHFRHYPVDADDTIFLLCALNGAATHMVTYDRHLLDVGVFYDGFRTCGSLDFLSDLDSTKADQAE